MNSYLKLEGLLVYFSVCHWLIFSCVEQEIFIIKPLFVRHNFLNFRSWKCKKAISKVFRRGIKRELVTRKSTIQKLCNQTQHHLSFKHFRQASDETTTSLATTGFRASSLNRQQSSGLQSLGLQSSGPSQVGIQGLAEYMIKPRPVWAVKIHDKRQIQDLRHF